MTIRASKFTPEVLLSTPRRSAGIPNSDASKVLYSVSTYNFSEHAKSSEIRLLGVKSQQTGLITDAKGASEPLWLDDDTVVLLSEGEDGVTSVRVGCVQDFGKGSYEAGRIDGPVGNLKVVSTGNGTFGIAVTGKATPDGELYNPEKAEKPQSSGRLYAKPFVRHWDHYVTENRNTIFLGTLTKKGGKYKLSELTNALKDSGLESPIDPFGGTDNFDISINGLVFTAKDPELDPALHTKTNIYLLASKSFWSGLPKTLPKSFQIPIFNFEGASTSPVWDTKGTQIAFLSMKTDGYESDKNQVFVVSDYRTPGWVNHLWGTKDGKGLWDRSPQSISWGSKGQIYFTAEENGRVDLFTTVANTPGGPLPTKLVKGGTITSVHPLKNGEIFLSSTSLVENSLYTLVPSNYANETLAGQATYSIPLDDRIQTASLNTKYISSASRSGAMLGLSRNQIDEIRWPGANQDVDTEIHAWAVKPRDFDEKKKYPLAYLIHGGPQGAWTDSWSTRWNPAVFAEQGFVVICPNPTGSTGYGQDFVDAIQGQWGGLPYEDLVLGFDYIKDNLEYVDTDRAVALGASYGGYMMNWIQGHDLGRRFKALVTHDGVFSMTSQLASEELYFPFHDLKGPLWENPDAWAEWDPSRFADQWATPQLIIHSDLDYRLTMNEGLSAFNVLQTRGVESQLLTFPDENHWVLKPENSLMWHEVVLDWINGHVGLEKYTEAREKARKGAQSVDMVQHGGRA
ncbi:dipeptidyl-peptidase-like protein V precursor [Lentithecium fluviatile CBS 122367]|uniref:Dipeptidyl-peptidase V n=1 Tax=Lentithecium fluviatile CBS 122367 TaxID=1168545 RepID=A0A6G1IWK9_9PLEO|nr:dipeptidyl-peptidase-like protein V precursor [Lentithecium fluviatile CBS 122367]